jgi:SAM-dependent MidA family methyltransferase
MSLQDALVAQIRATGPVTVAAFVERALYDPAAGYYSTSPTRSGRDGDFFTSVDAGPLFGELLAELVVRVWLAACRAHAMRPAGGAGPRGFDLVEAGAGNGRLMRDVLDALATACPTCYDSLRVRLVERSEAARGEHVDRLGPHARLLESSSPDLPTSFGGLLFANELLDAFPVHRVRMTPGGLREVFVAEERGRLVLEEGPPSSPALAGYFEDVGVPLPIGITADISPAAVAWVREAASRMESGAMLLIDYGHDAATLFSAPRTRGTLASCSRHQLDPEDAAASDPRHPAWLHAPGTRDLTAHVDFTAVGCAARAAGATGEWLVDQTRLLLWLGLGQRLSAATGSGLADVKWRLAAKSLAVPHGLGGTHRALLLTKDLAPGALALERYNRVT